MEQRIQKLLFDIRYAIGEIEGYFENHPKDFNLYKSNTLLKRAVERDLEIIGEAVNRILKIDRNFKIEVRQVAVASIKKMNTRFNDLLNAVTLEDMANQTRQQLNSFTFMI
jgi:uncharacterized protein with HEPN domain